MSRRGKKGLNYSRDKVKAYTVAGSGEKSLLRGPGSEIQVGRSKEKEKHEDNLRDD